MQKPLAIVFAILSLLILCLAVSKSTNADASINVFSRSPLSADAHYPETTKFDFVIVNNDTERYYVVNISCNVTESTFSISENHFIIEPKSVKEVSLEIKPYKRLSKNIFGVIFEVRNALNLSQNLSFAFTLEINYLGVVPTEKVLGTFENFLPYPFNNNYGVFILDVILWCVIIVALYYFIERILAKVVLKTETDLDDRIMAIVRKPLLVFFITYAIVSSTEILDLPEIFYFYLYNIYWSVVILLFGYVAYRIWKDVIIYFFRKVAQKTETEIDDILVPIFDKVGGAVIVVVILVYFVNKVFSIDVTLLVASMGVLGLIIGFAAQDSLSNFFSGILLLLDRPFAEGDIVTLGDGDKWYRVEKIGLRSTRFYSLFEDVMVTLPNNKLASEKIINVVEPTDTLRGRVDFSVSYGSDPRKVMEIAKEVVLSFDEVLRGKDVDPVVRFVKFGESSLDFAIFFRVKNYNDKYRVESEVRTKLFERFKKEGIEIPFPQLDVHIKNGKGG